MGGGGGEGSMYSAHTSLGAITENMIISDLLDYLTYLRRIFIFTKMHIVTPFLECHIVGL